MTVAEQVYEQTKLVPEPVAREALNFVLSLRSGGRRDDVDDLVRAQAVLLADICDNSEDEAWDNVQCRGSCDASRPVL